MRLYHVTKTYLVPKILREGLKPSTGSEDSPIGEGVGGPKGVFFFTSIPQMVRELGLDFSVWMIEDEDCSVLEVDLPETFKVHEWFEYDRPEGDFYSVYSTKTISPKYIRNLGGLFQFVKKGR